MSGRQVLILILVIAALLMIGPIASADFINSVIEWITKFGEHLGN
jgi:hypothetical protein